MARPHRSFGSKSARLTQWSGPADQGYIVVGGGASVLLSSLSPEAPLTVIRTRGWCSFKPTDPSVNGEFRGAYGLMVVSNEALGIGVTAIPGPWDDPDGDWMVWRSFAGTWDVTTDVGRALTAVSFEIDSKAMRKVGPNESIVTLVESQGGGSFGFFTGVRKLLKLA